MGWKDWLTGLARRSPSSDTDTVSLFKERVAAAAGEVIEGQASQHTLAREAYGAVAYLFEERGHFQSFMHAARTLGKASVEFGMFPSDAPVFGGTPLSIEDSAFYVAVAVAMGNTNNNRAACALLSAHVRLREVSSALDRELNASILTASAKRADKLRVEREAAWAEISKLSLGFFNSIHVLLRPQVYASWHSFAGNDARNKFPPVHVFAKRYAKDV